MYLRTAGVASGIADSSSVLGNYSGARGEVSVLDWPESGTVTSRKVVINARDRFVRSGRGGRSAHGKIESDEKAMCIVEMVFRVQCGHGLLHLAMQMCVTQALQLFDRENVWITAADDCSRA